MCDAHLNTCQQCQKTLTELRETVALLHALPQPTLPRSFTLAADTVVAHLAPVQPLSPTPLHAAPRRRAWPRYVQGMVRAVSTIAAVIGIVFLLSGLIGIVPSRSGGSTTSNNAHTAVPASGPQDKALTPSIQGQDRSSTPSAPGATPGVTSRNQPDEKPARSTNPAFSQTNQPNPFQFLIHAFDLSTPGGRALLGSVLLILGLVSFVLLRRL